MDEKRSSNVAVTWQRDECNENTAHAAWALENTLQQTDIVSRSSKSLPTPNVQHKSILTAAYVVRCQELLATFQEVQSRLEFQATHAWPQQQQPHNTADAPQETCNPTTIDTMLHAVSERVHQELSKQHATAMVHHDGLAAIDLGHMRDPTWLQTQVLALPECKEIRCMAFSQLVKHMQDVVHALTSHMLQGATKPNKALQGLRAAMQQYSTQQHMNVPTSTTKPPPPAQPPLSNPKHTLNTTPHTAPHTTPNTTAEVLAEELHAWRTRHVEQCCAVDAVMQSCGEVEGAMEGMLQELRGLTSPAHAQRIAAEATCVGMQASIQNMQKNAAILAQELLEGRQQDHALQQQLDDIQKLTQQHQHHDARITGLMHIIDRLTRQLTTVNSTTIAQLQGPTKQQLHDATVQLRRAQDVVMHELQGCIDVAGRQVAGAVGVDDMLVESMHSVRKACSAATQAMQDACFSHNTTSITTTTTAAAATTTHNNNDNTNTDTTNHNTTAAAVDGLLSQAAACVEGVETVHEWCTTEAVQQLEAASQACTHALVHNVPAAAAALEEWWKQPALEALPWATVEGRTASEWCQHILEAAGTIKSTR